MPATEEKVPQCSETSTRWRWHDGCSALIPSGNADVAPSSTTSFHHMHPPLALALNPAPSYCIRASTALCDLWVQRASHSHHRLSSALFPEIPQREPTSSSSMFKPLPTTRSSSNFRVIFERALKTYQKTTKQDLSAHPLASQLQGCDSPASILTMLQGQVGLFTQSQIGSERLKNWLNPTINVLYAFSATLGGSLEPVRRTIFRTQHQLKKTLFFIC